jgi:hypothetical protein
VFLLVAAATDSTGRTIMLLTAGLIIVAIALAVLTVWYWRFTSPRRRLVPEPPRQPPDSLPAAVESSSSAAPSADLRPESDPSPEPHTSPVAAVLAATVAGDVPSRRVTWSEGAPAEQIEGAQSADAPLGLDGDQWAMLTQAVFDQFMDQTETDA